MKRLLKRDENNESSPFLASRRTAFSGRAVGLGGRVQWEGGRRCTFRGQGQLSQLPDAGTTQAELSH